MIDFSLVQENDGTWYVKVSAALQLGRVIEYRCTPNFLTVEQAMAALARTLFNITLTSTLEKIQEINGSSAVILTRD